MEKKTTKVILAIPKIGVPRIGVARIDAARTDVERIGDARIGIPKIVGKMYQKSLILAKVTKTILTNMNMMQIKILMMMVKNH